MTQVSIRQRMLEGVLLRLSKLPNAGGVVLRGGMLLRHWFYPTPRIALDLDLVAPAPLAIEDAKRFQPMFSDSVDDNVSFDVEGIKVEGIWLQSDHPGVRMHVRGSYADMEDEIQVDVTGGPSPTPAAVLSDIRTASGTVCLWTCRPESILAQKVQALWHLGMLGWRAKDLDDIRLLLERIPMDNYAIIQAIDTTFAELGGTRHDAQGVFSPQSWWQTKHASARWSDFVNRTDRVEVRRLSAVVANVTTRLKPLLEELP